MTEQEVEAIDRALRKVKELIVELTSQKVDIEFSIEELESIRVALTQLLPPQKRIDNLFS